MFVNGFIFYKILFIILQELVSKLLKVLRPAGFFKVKENQKQFINDLGKKLNYNTTTDWYQIRGKDVKKHGGKTLMAQFNDSAYEMVMAIMNDVTWLPWLFQRRSKLRWTESHSDCLRYMEYLPFFILFFYTYMYIYIYILKF